MVTQPEQTVTVELLDLYLGAYRVLWMAVQLRTVSAVAEVFRDEPEIVERVVRAKLLEQPEGSPNYVFTRKGCEWLGRWFERVYPRREEPGFREHWKRVTGRDF